MKYACNAKRAARAKTAIEDYIARHGDGNDPIDTALRDIFCDIFHLAFFEGIDIETALKDARRDQQDDSFEEESMIIHEAAPEMIETLRSLAVHLATMNATITKLLGSLKSTYPLAD